LAFDKKVACYRQMFSAVFVNTDDSDWTDFFQIFSYAALRQEIFQILQIFNKNLKNSFL
jgi:hypothetical protein